MFRFPIIFSFVLTPILLLGCQPIHPKNNAENSVKEKIEAYLSKLEALGFNGTVLVDIEGKKILSKGYGWSNRTDQIKNQPTTVFDIGSITKQFTAAAILKLEMMGKLSVQDKMSQYLEGVPVDKKNITLHHLLTHSAGFPSGIGDDYEPISTVDFIQKAFNQPLLFTPGEEYEYSNVGYSLLGIIIEKISGKTYEQFLYENLWKPAGMEFTGYSRPHFDPSKIAVGYERNGEAWGKPNEQKWDVDAPFWNLKANGGILSTTEDMYKWHRALLGNKILDEQAIEKYFHPYIQEKPAPSFYAYGWAIYTTSRNTKMAAHNGGNGIFFADFWRYLDDKVTIIIMTNSADRYSEIIASQIGAIIFLPDFEPTFPSPDGEGSESEFDQDQVVDFANLTLEILDKKDEKVWEDFIKKYGTNEFLKMASMETHLNFFTKFHNKLKGGKIKGVQLEDDELILAVQTPNGMENLILNIAAEKNGDLKLAGMMVE